MGAKGKTFRPPGTPSAAGLQGTARPRALAQACRARAQARRSFPRRIVKQNTVFFHGFAAVAALAEALQIAFAKQFHVAAMRDDMIRLCRPDTQSPLGAFTAERLAGQLSVSAVFPAKARIGVQVMPGSGFLPLMLRLMLRAPALGGQRHAPRCFAHPHGFVYANTSSG